jgi:hypothetical protein
MLGSKKLDNDQAILVWTILFYFIVMFVSSISLIKIRSKPLKCDIILVLIFN